MTGIYETSRYAPLRCVCSYDERARVFPGLFSLSLQLSVIHHRWFPVPADTRTDFTLFDLWLTAVSHLPSCGGRGHVAPGARSIQYVFICLDINETSDFSIKRFKLWAGSCLWMNQRMFCALRHTLSQMSGNQSWMLISSLCVRSFGLMFRFSALA